MNTNTPRTDGMQRAAIVVKLNYMAKQYTNGAIARGGSLSKHYLEEAADIIKAQEADNARLSEEVEMLNVRHAAAMLHAQTHADEYNALREDEKGLLQDIQRLTEEAFKRDEKLAIQSNANVGLMEELAEAKREIEQRGELANRHAKAYADAQARALANEKDAGRYRFLRSESTTSAQIQVMNDETQPPYFTLKSGEELDAAIDAAIAGAKHD